MTKSGPPPNKKALGVIAGLVTLASLAVVYLTLFPWPPRLDRAPFQALGQRLGQEALLLQQPGSRIILITRETDQFKTPAFEAQTEGFHQALKRAGVKVATTRILKVDPLRVVAVPPGEFFELYRKLEDRDIIVSLLGPPQMDAGQLAKIGDKRPRVLAVCSGALPQQIDLKRLFEDKLLHAAVISRNEPAAGGSGAAFDRRFKFITAANVAELPGPLAALP